MTGELLLKEIQAELSGAPAAEVAEAFLSPHIEAEFFLQALDEEGPSLWIVNRSDVWNETLALLAKHRLPGISERAKEKISARSRKVITFAAPEVPKTYAEITDESVEDYLGHPLAPFEAMIFFSRSLNEDHRGSAALSFARRVLEFPPQWFEEKISKAKIFDAMLGLLDDPSPYVRSYAARNPLLETPQLEAALKREANPTVRSRLLQHPATSLEMVESVLLEKKPENSDATLQFIAALDGRLTHNARNQMLNNRELPSITRRIHEWHLLR
jgi:hypothetical protein